MFSIYNPFLSFVLDSVHMTILLWMSDSNFQVLVIIAMIITFIAYTARIILGIPVITVSSPASKLHQELGWKPAESFDTGIEKTVDWYLANQAWVNNVTSGDYRHWVAKHYAERGEELA